MQVGQAEDDDLNSQINTTPLVDVMLVLLIIFLITIPMQTQNVTLNLPKANQPPTPVQPQVVTIDIDFDGTIIWNGDTLSGRPELESRMRASAAMQDQPEIHLRPNKLVKYRNVAMVMASAQRLGLTKVGIIGHEQFIR